MFLKLLIDKCKRYERIVFFVEFLIFALFRAFKSKMRIKIALITSIYQRFAILRIMIFSAQKRAKVKNIRKIRSVRIAYIYQLAALRT